MQSFENMKCLAIVHRTDSTETAGVYSLISMAPDMVSAPKGTHYIQVENSIEGPPGKDGISGLEERKGLWVGNDTAEAKIHFYPASYVRSRDEAKPEGIEVIQRFSRGHSGYPSNDGGPSQ